jgi:hypothetical protein
VKIAKADLVPTEANLLAAYGSFAELEVACETFCGQVNSRAHRVTRRRGGTRCAVAARPGTGYRRAPKRPAARMPRTTMMTGLLLGATMAIYSSLPRQTKIIVLGHDLPRQREDRPRNPRAPIPRPPLKSSARPR